MWTSWGLSGIRERDGELKQLQERVVTQRVELKEAREGTAIYKQGQQIASAEVKRLEAEVAGLRQGVAYQQTVVQQWGQQQTPTRSRITGTQWDACCTADGKMYYVDVETGKTQWALPLQEMRTA